MSTRVLGCSMLIESNGAVRSSSYERVADESGADEAGADMTGADDAGVAVADDAAADDAGACDGLVFGNFCINSPGVGICAACASRMISISHAAAGLGAWPSSPWPFSNSCHARPRRAMPDSARPAIISRSLSISASLLPPAACMLARWIKSKRSVTSISGSAPRL